METGERLKPEPQEVVRAILHDTAMRVLVVKRRRGTNAGLWSLPGGKPESGESLDAAIARKVLEAVDVPVESFTPRGVTSHSDRQAYWYEAPVRPEEVRPDGFEVAEVRFVAAADLNDLNIACGHREVLQTYFERPSAFGE